jgi:hypothetical protein
MVTNKDIAVYHEASWLPGVLVYTPTTLDFPTIDRTNIVSILNSVFLLANSLYLF